MDNLQTLYLTRVGSISLTQTLLSTMLQYCPTMLMTWFQKKGKYWSLMCEAAEPKLKSDKDYWGKSSLIEKTINSLVNYCFINASKVVSRYQRRLEHGYPVPFLKREIFLKEIQPWLESRHIYSRGRFGGWRYEVGNQDHSFM